VSNFVVEKLEQNGTVRFPLTGTNYPNNAACRWRIIAPVGKVFIQEDPRRCWPPLYTALGVWCRASEAEVRQWTSLYLFARWQCRWGVL